MPRAAARYVFAALLALLSAQAGVPSVRVVTTIEIVYRTEAEQQIPRAVRRVQARIQFRQSATYASRIRPEPDAAILFQRPPPISSLFS
jgi:hypothetical protein